MPLKIELGFRNRDKKPQTIEETLKSILKNLPIPLEDDWKINLKSAQSILKNFLTKLQLNDFDIPDSLDRQIIQLQYAQILTTRTIESSLAYSERNKDLYIRNIDFISKRKCENLLTAALPANSQLQSEETILQYVMAARDVAHQMAELHANHAIPTDFEIRSSLPVFFHNLRLARNNE